MAATYVLIGASLFASGWALWLQASGLHAIYTRWQRQRRLHMRVIERIDHGEEVFTVRLARTGGGCLPAYEAGQHVLLSVPQQPGLRRAYSLASWTRRPCFYEFTIKREAQGRVSPQLFEHLTPGCKVVTSRPQGHFVLNTLHRRVVLVAGGVGITPMRAMLLRFAAQRHPPEQVILWYASRYPEGLVYHEELQALARRLPWFEYCPMVSRPDEHWCGRTGRLDAAGIKAAPGTHYYFCALQQMMDDLCDGLKMLGVADTELHWESFGIRSAGDQNAGPFLVRLEEGKQCEWIGQPSLLHALEDAGIALPAECRAGECGACRLRVLEGSTKSVMPGKAAGQEILACCMVPESDLLLGRP